MELSASPRSDARKSRNDRTSGCGQRVAIGDRADGPSADGKEGKEGERDERRARGGGMV